jgi:hypothetical protein
MRRAGAQSPSPAGCPPPLPSLSKKVIAACVVPFFFTLLLYARALENGFVN